MKLNSIKRVKVEKENGVNFELNCSIRNDIIKLESTEKTRAFGVPEYMTISYRSDITAVFRNREKNDGWSVRITSLRGLN